MHFHEEKVTIGKPDPSVAALLADKGNETSLNASIAEEEKSVTQENQTKSSRLNRMTQRGGGDKEKEEKYKATVLTKRLTNEPPLD